MRRALATLSILALLASSGCARTPTPVPPSGIVRARTVTPADLAASPWQPVDERLDAVQGQTLIVPLSVARDRLASLPASLPLRLDDGRRIEAPVVLLVVAPSEPQAHAWLPPSGRWSVARVGAAIPADHGVQPVALVDFPPDHTSTGLWFGGLRVPLAMLPDPGALLVGGAMLPWPPGAGEHAGNLLLNQLAQPDRQDPTRRWRHELLTQGLAPDPALHTPAARTDDAASILHAIDMQSRGRWQVALAWLYRAAPEVSMQLRQRLACAVRVGTDAAPLAFGSPRDLEILLSDLLDTRLTPPQRVARARAFIDAQPQALALVLDDAGRRDGGAGATPLSTFSLFNLSSRPALATLASAAAGISPQPVSIPPWSWATGSFPAIAFERSSSPAVDSDDAIATGSSVEPPPSPAGRTAELRVGGREIRVPVLAEAIPILPPGLELRPVLHDWTMPAALSAQPDAAMTPAPEWSTAGLLYLDTDGESQPVWRVLIESRLDPVFPAGGTRDAIELWLGPTGAPAAAWRVWRDGSIEAIRGTGPASAPRIATSADRWTAVLDVPPAAIDAAGQLRIGLVRSDSRGLRAAWPRPMLPWQAEPGRALLDTRSWQAPAPPRPPR